MSSVGLLLDHLNKLRFKKTLESCERFYIRTKEISPDLIKLAIYSGK